jgi:hypothetical protein
MDGQTEHAFWIANHAVNRKAIEAFEIGIYPSASALNALSQNTHPASCGSRSSLAPAKTCWHGLEAASPRSVVRADGAITFPARFSSLREKRRGGKNVLYGGLRAMDEQLRVRAVRVIRRIERALDSGVQFADGGGRRLANVEAVLNAWAHGGLTVKDPNNAEIIGQWIRG